MTLFINVAAAWISVALVILLAIIYLLRILNKGKRKSKLIAKINKKLRNSHKSMGIAFVIFAGIHGFFSSGAMLSFNFGTLCMATGILLGLTYLFRKIFPKKYLWIKPHRWLTVVLIVFLGLHLWQIGGIMGPEAFFTGVTSEIENSVAKLYGGAATTATTTQTETTSTANSGTASISSPVTDAVVTKANLFMENVDLKDGTYTGVADGYGPNLTVSVTVASNVITDVRVVSQNEVGVQHYGKAIDAVPAEIIAKQTPVVDTISGATYTSNGIMKAVINALEKAVISGTLPSL
ncbi:FMN-binding protein [Acetobacterium paludosum]|uniref:FMN-binding protein n=1 Tax=Acetobacterium paludosum TaxID=52693 RepID=A0A923HWP4_9FIRM|nr:FMN-binding protein [Acetobacterium paludosum]MBC3888009.1 FMN-binding protein [Acetobacterium paludosum]